jgi:hypothetical protein
MPNDLYVTFIVVCPTLRNSRLRAMDDHVFNDVLNDDGNNYMNEALRGRGSPRYWFVRDCLKFYGRVLLVRARA